MNKRGVEIDWSKLENASPKPKRLHLEEDDSDGLFHCPVQDCNMMGLQRQEDSGNTQRTNIVGTFISTKSQTSLRLNQANKKSNKMEVSDHKIPPKSRRVVSFAMSSEIAQDFLSWLTGSGGGCKSDWQSHQIVSKCLKFLNSVAKKRRILHLKSLTLVYVRPIYFSNLLTWCKTIGMSGTQGTELYLKRVRKTVSIIMQLQWTSELDIEALEAKRHWATLVLHRKIHTLLKFSPCINQHKLRSFNYIFYSFFSLAWAHNNGTWFFAYITRRHIASSPFSRECLALYRFLFNTEISLLNTRRALGSRRVLFAALRKRAKIMQGWYRYNIPTRLIVCYQISRRIFVYQGQRIAPDDISIFNCWDGEQR